MTGSVGRRSYRSLFVSDLHLGSRFCDVDGIADFLGRNDAETLYLVGDIVDLWSLGARVRWHGGHGRILRLLCEKMQQGTRLVLLPGNHDDNLRDFLGLSLGAFEICHEHVHTTASGVRYLVVHGDRHDKLICNADRLSRAACRWKERIVPKLAWVSRSGDKSPRESPPPSSLRAWLRDLTSNTRSIECALAAEAAQRGFDGVISGHTHAPADLRIAGVHYLNCGDWIGSSTAVGETWSGDMQLVRWSHHKAASVADAATAPDLATADPLCAGSTAL